MYTFIAITPRSTLVAPDKGLIYRSSRTKMFTYAETNCVKYDCFSTFELRTYAKLNSLEYNYFDI